MSESLSPEPVEKSVVDGPPPVEGVGVPLSFGQEALWFLSRLAPESRAYHLCGAARVLGAFDPARLRRAFSALAARHPALRTTFAEGANGTPEQRVGSGPGIAFSHEFVTTAEELAARLTGNLDAPFDLERGPLVRAGLISTGTAGETVLWLAAHHLVADFWSLAVMLRDLGAAYGAEGGAEGEIAAPPLRGVAEPQLSYAEWARRQRERTAGPEGERELAAWKEALAGEANPELPRLELPTDRPRRAKTTWAGGAVDLAVAPEATRSLGRVARGAKSNLFSALLTAFDAFLSRLTGQDDLIVGTPTTGRFGAPVADQVGYFVNPVPVRAALSGDPAFAELLARQKPAIQTALALQSYPFSRLAEEIQPERDAGRSPVFDVMLAYEKARGGEGFWGFALGLAGTRVDLGGLALESLRVEPSGSPFDLSLAVSEVAGGLAGSLRYSSELFDRATAGRWAGQLVRLIEGAAAEPNLRLSDLPLLSPAEREELLATGAAGPSAAAGIPAERSFLDEGFARWERETPEALAVSDDTGRSSYRELGGRANRLAHHLRSLGIAEESRVAICLDRSAELVAAMLGVLRAGAAFVPIDPAYPEERRAAMVERSGAAAVVTLDSLAGPWCGGAAVVRLDALSGTAPAPPTRLGAPEQLAYVIFTSGSTGTPKGVAISHRAALHMAAWYARRFGYGPADRVSQIAGPGFDATVSEIWPALGAGASLHVPPVEVRLSPAALLRWLADERIAIAFLPTPLAEAAFAEPAPAGLALRYLTVGGDRLHRGAPADFPAHLVNMYGPAENAVVTTAGDVPAEDPQPSIGRPIDGARVYLLDRSLGLVPTGSVGELAAAGPGLARGYFGDPGETASRFRPDPFGEPGERLYRTGDLARFRPSGEIDFLGRLDHQVKIRGQRIELGEIESALASLPGVREAAVLVHEASPGDRRLVAFVAAGDEVSESGLIESLRRRLSDAMVPRTFVRLERLPANANGKVDRKALAALAARAVAEEGAGEREGTAPRTETERAVAAIWRELLGRERIGVEEDFFALGGHSLLVTQLASRLRRTFGIEFALNELFAGATVAKIAARVEEKLAEGEDSERIVRVARPSDVPLSFSQERLWFVDRLEPGKATYNVGFRLTLDGPLKSSALEAAFAVVVARHEPLRTRYAQPGDVARQEIDPPSLLSRFSRWPFVDLGGGLGEKASAREGERVARAEGRRPFDLSRGPVARAVLVRRASNLHDAIFSFHHIAIDGWSLSVFSREIAELYAAAAEGRAARLPKLPIAYADWAIWQRAWFSGDRYERELAWWRGHLAGAPEAIDLPTDRPRPSSPRRQAAQVRRTLPPQLSQAIAARANAESSTPFMMLLAAWAGLLSRLGSGSDLVIGTPIANRNRAETEGLIGFFVNSLAIRVSAGPAASLRSLLAHAREASVGAFAHQDFPFERLVAELGGARGGNVPPIYQVSFAFQNLPAPVMLPGLSTRVEELDGGAAKLDLGLVVTPVGDRLEAQLEIDLDLFDPATGARLLLGFERMAAEVAARPEKWLGEAELLGPAERQQLLVEWNEGGAELPAVLVHDSVARWARERPEALALESEHEPGRKYSWREVAAHTDRLARRLAGMGAGPERVVAVSLERSVDRVLTMIAIWKAGACYLPVDPELPEERRALLLADAGAVVVIAREAPPELAGLRRAVTPLLIDRTGVPTVIPSESEESGRMGGSDPVAARGFEGAHRSDPSFSLGMTAGEVAALGRAVPENLAYVIYTSGSTGVPKGVGISHRHAAGHFAAAAELYRMDPSDRVVQFASASFDVSMEQVGVALASGATLLVRGPELPPPLEISAWLARLRISVANLPTAVWSEWSWSEAPLPPGLRLVIAGGEAMAPAAAERFRLRLAGCERAPVVLNAYGPTETVVTASCHDVRFGRLPESGAVSIGRVLPGRAAYVVDSSGRPLPLGGIGELALGGLLARGYLDRPELSAERFRPDPFGDQSGERLYWTGDRVRRQGDGAFDYLGRIDDQIKIRGFRIEPGEIEAALAAHPGVKEAIVLAREAPGVGKRLIAWYVPREAGAALTPGPSPEGRGEIGSDLRRFLSGRLPDFLVPAAFVEVAEWPLTPTGKVDRRALPDPSFESGAAERIAPRTPAEEIVAGLLAELLGAPEVGADSDFFALGGHSLLATQLASRIRKTFGVELPLAELFSSSTVEAVAGRIEALAGGPLPPPLVRKTAPGKEGEGELSFAEERLWFLDRLEPGSATYHVGFRLGLDGSLAVAPFAAALSAVVLRHDRLRTRFVEREGKPFAVVDSAGAVSVPLVDLSAIESGAEASRLADGEGRRPFDLARGPLLRVTLLRFAPDRHEALFVFHHIATDGWSMAIFSRDLVAFYGAAIEGRPADLPALPIDYSDFAAWQRGWLAGEVYDRELSWWRERLSGAPEVLELPSDRPRPARRIHAASHLVWRDLSPELSSAIGARARTAGATPFMLLLAAWGGLLSRLAAGSDLVIGTPVANRNRAETEGVVGFFVNSLPIRISTAAASSDGGQGGSNRGGHGGAPLHMLLGRVREAALSAYAHQDFPFERLVAEIGARGGGAPPIYQTSLVLQNVPEPAMLPGLLSRVEPLSGGGPKVDLGLGVSPVRAGGTEHLSVRLEVDLDLFDPATGARLLAGFEAMAAALALAPERRLLDVELLSAPERHQMLVEEGAESFDLPPRRLHDFLEKNARERPDDPALESEHEPGRRFSWRELAARTELLARRLAGLGAGPERVVGVSLEWSVDRPLAIYAIWRAGACYLPVDPELPVERRALLLADAGAVALVTRERFWQELPVETPANDRSLRCAPLLLRSEDGLPRDPGPVAETRAALPENLAYILYTSGSTGTPKGVAVSHAHAAAHLAEMVAAYRMGEGERILQFAAASFDVSMEQIGIALTSGGTLVVRGPELPAPAELSAWLGRLRITQAHISTAIWTEWSWSDPREAPLPETLRALIVGGEAMGAAAAGRFAALLATRETPPTLWNGYGPTEAVIDATLHEVRPGDRASLGAFGAVPIGKLLPRRSGYVADPLGVPLPAGGRGELLLGGLLARGYYGRPDLTAERFRPDASGVAREPGARVYWTGDRARLDAQGAFEFLGRIDQQVKVRGFRIEPGEIEAALALHPRVKEAIVLARGGSESRRLIAWYRPRRPRDHGRGPVAEGDLIRHLAARLPEYMIPVAFVEIAEWPKTATGKIDRKALPEPARLAAGREVAPLRTPAQEIVAGMFAELLGRERGEGVASLGPIGADSDFFALGGHSLLATQLASRLRRTFEVELPLADLFVASTVAGIAERIEALAGGPLASAPPPLVRIGRGGEPVPLSFAQERLWFLDRLEPRRAAYNLGFRLMLEGELSPAAIAALDGAFAAVVARHEPLRTRYPLDDDRPVQEIGPPESGAGRMAEVDLSGGDLAQASAAEAARIAEAFGRRPFDLAAGPVLRTARLRRGAAASDLLFAFHHIATDGWSTALFSRELVEGYAAALEGRPALLPALPISYADWAIWQRRYLSGEVYDAEVAWWRERLEGAPETTELPFDRPRPERPVRRAAALRLDLPEDLSAALAVRARASGATLFMALLAAWAGVLSRYSGEREGSELVIGTPIANRNRAETEGLIGFFVNSLALRISMEAVPGEGGHGGPPLQVLLARTRAAALAAYGHQDLPFDRLVAELPGVRPGNAPPVYQVSFGLQNLPEPVHLPGFVTTFEELGGGTAKFDLSLMVLPADGRLSAMLEIDLDLFDPATGRRLLRSFAALAASLAEHPQKTLAEAELLGSSERHQLLAEWNDAEADLPPDVLPDFLARHARERPDDPALESEHEPRRYTWRELDEATDRLARRLAGLGAGPERVVAVSLPWSVDRALAVYAIWKAGACYLPVDPDLPPERRALLLEDAGAVVVIAREVPPELAGLSRTVVPLLLQRTDFPPVFPSESEESGRAGGADPATAKGWKAAHPPDPSLSLGMTGEGLAPETGPETIPRPALPDNLAYLIYTSGSTGTPKGVAVSHRHAAAHFEGSAANYGWNERDRAVLLGAASFDLSVDQIGVALAAGSTLVVRGPEPSAPADLSAWFERLGITCATLPTPLWAEWTLAPEPLPPRLRRLYAGGEAMSAAAARRFVGKLAAMADPARMWNAYGPTEAVVAATCHDLAAGYLPESGAVPIGRSMARRTAYVLDAVGAPQPFGGRGELALGGVLARGYLRRPDLTAERFRPDPFGGVGARLYWTGDRVRRRNDGGFDYLGRIDRQLKIRGVRIEPGEIEAALARHPQVAEAIVLARESTAGGARLIAWYRRHTSGAAIEPAELQRFLAARLPDAMVPRAFVEMAEWPLNPSGKVDRRALPEPSAEIRETGRVALRTPAEEIVAGIFAELLGSGELGAEADFFALGGHSLLATQLASRLRRAFGVELPLAEIFAAPTVAGIAAGLEKRLSEGDDVEPIPRGVRPLDVPLSFAQERLWFIDRLEPGKATYNVGFRLALEGPFSPAALEAALAAVVARHEPLRTRYAQPDDVARQEIDPPSVGRFSRWPQIELTALEETSASEEAERTAHALGRRPFDLARGPVVRATLVRREPRLHDAIFTFHHVAIDGWSIAVFSREIAELYAAAVEAREARLPELPIGYADWAIWQRERLSGDRYLRELAWWRHHLEGAPEALDLPADRPRPAVPKRRAVHARRTLSPELSQAIRSRANAESSTPFMMLLAAWAGLLSRLGSGSDLVLGTPIANRNRAETEGLIGFFVNSLAIRISVEAAPSEGGQGGPPLRALLAQTRAASLGAFAHQDFPFERLVAELGGARGGNVPPIYQVSFAFQNLPEPVLLPGLSTRVEELSGGAAKLDLGLVAIPLADRLEVRLELDSDRFDPATGARLLAGFERMAAELAAHPERRLAEAELLGPAERQQLLYEWSDWSHGGAELPSVSVHDFVARWARERPEALALESEHEPGRRYSWREVAAHTDLLARRLVGLGAGPERVVAVSLERSVDRVLAMLAIWRAGACYLPVDPELPAERRALLLEDARAVVVMAREVPPELAGLKRAVATLIIDRTGAPSVIPSGSEESGWRGGSDPVTAEGFKAAHPPDPSLSLGMTAGEGKGSGPAERPRAACPENLAYVIYTSGSTGVPKGVGISHRHAAAHFAAAAGFYGLAASDRIVQFASASFDVSMEQTGLALASGATLVVRGPELPPPLELSAWLGSLGITVANLPTAVWTEWSWSEEPLPEALRVLITGGEAMAPAAAERFRLRLAKVDRPPVVFNAYGPTETVVTATCSDVRFGQLPESGSVSIGRLLPNRSGYVVDADGRPQPLGGVGELALGGLLARGYLDRPELTAERFRPNPLTDKVGERLYWTGDRVRQRGDGSFDYLGRIDSQMKIRGFRIEPGEIEAALSAHPAVKEAIVLARERAETGKRLIAWFRPRDGEGAPAAADLARFLAGRLPAYMLPAAFVEVGEWPVSPSGKIDRRALPDPPFEASGRGNGRIAPRTPAEEIVAGLFSELLGVPEIGAEADFFALGGHSLLATRLVSRLRNAFGAELPLAEVFAASTVAGIAGRIEALAGRPEEALRPLARGARPEAIPLSFAQERLWFLDRLEPGTSTYNVGFRLVLSGALLPSALAAAVRALVARHEPLRTRFALADDRPVQRIDPPGEVGAPEVDLSRLGADRSGREAGRLAAFEGRRPFDLARGPVFRWTRVRRGALGCEALFVFHHIATDGWSAGVFSRDLAELYAAASEGRPADLPPLPIGYADWALWQRGWLAGEVYDRQLAWWRDRLAGAPEVLDLPFDRPRPMAPSRRARTLRRRFAPGVATAVAARSRAAGSTVYMTLLAAFAALLSRLSAGRDLVIGLPIANRNRAETEGLVGFFVNSLPVRISTEPEPGGDLSLGDLLVRARAAALGALAHQDFPFDRLVAELGGARGGGIPPVYQVSLMLQNLPAPLAMPGLVAAVEELGGGAAKLDLGLAAVPLPEEGTDRLLAILELNLDLFDPATGARLLAGFEAMAREVAAHPERPLAEAELLGTAERHQPLVEWNDRDLATPPARVHDWIALHARVRPDAPALESEHEPGRRYTWAEADARADLLARRLAGLGAGPERVVAVSLERSVDRVLAMYAIWKAGACHLPVDPELPAERRALLLADAGAMALVARRETCADLPAEILAPEGKVAPLLLSREDGLPEQGGPEAAPVPAQPENLAYVIYTSGSTGLPKGVAISHAHAAGHFGAAAAFYRMDPSDRVVQFAAASFDVSMEQVGVALASGGALLVRGPELPPPLDLSAWMTRHGITNANLPTAVWSEWSRSKAPLPECLRVLVTGGEAMTPDAAERFRGRLAEMESPPTVYNGYGPTETVVTATCYDLAVGRLPESGSVSIGRLLPARSGFVADGSGEVQALGGVGELMLGGLLARGYLDRPDLTADRFRPDPYGTTPGTRIYRTGDRVRQRGDGSFDYLGRTDGQIKVRGFRIEPGEIEAALLGHPAVKDSIVLSREVVGAGPRLIAWYRPLGEPATPSDLRAYLAVRLPDYMVPAAFVEVAEWPTTPTGKVDRRALPEPRRLVAAQRTPPTTSVQHLIAGLWREALPEVEEDLAIEDSFFELGGHSLLAVRITSKVAANFQVELPLKRLFEAPTIAGLEAAVLAAEARPGQSEKIARVLLRLKGLSPDEKKERLAAG